MTATTQYIRASTENLPINVRFALAMSMRGYYEFIGQFKLLTPIKPIISKIQKALVLKPTNSLSLTEYKLWQINPLDHAWRSQYLTDLPDYLAKHFADKYIALFRANGRRTANTFLRQTLGGQIKNRLKKVISKYDSDRSGPLSIQFSQELKALPEYNRKQITKLSEDIALYMQKTVFHFLDNKHLLLSKNKCAQYSLEVLTYQFLLSELQGLTLSPPYYQQYIDNKLTDEHATISLAKMTFANWWRNKLKRYRDMQREHLAIASGLVHRKASPYASLSCIAEWAEQKRRNRQFIKSMEIQNEETGERFPLSVSVDKSNANPVIRRCELMVRIRGFEDIAEEMGCVGEFLTLTAPSKYHNAYYDGGFVTRWNGYNPRETQSYLCSVFARIRAKLKRNHLRIFGFRVVEPHHDGTPHWHLLVFMQPEQRQQILEIFQFYALAEDEYEKGARENRFKSVPINKKFGSATGYIAKYISKNIDGYSLDGQRDFETDRDLKQTSKSIAAWASRWKIRQFQQIGGAPVTVWRELRRLRDKKVNNQTIASVLAAANMGNWAVYTTLQGGPMAAREHIRVRPSYKNETNQFNEVIKKINGVFSPILGLSSFICTRLITWSVIPKVKPFIKHEAKRLTWSSVNNCTQTEIVGAKDRQKKISEQRDRIDIAHDKAEMKMPYQQNIWKLSAT